MLVLRQSARARTSRRRDCMPCKRAIQPVSDRTLSNKRLVSHGILRLFHGRLVHLTHELFRYHKIGMTSQLENHRPVQFEQCRAFKSRHPQTIQRRSNPELTQRRRYPPRSQARTTASPQADTAKGIKATTTPRRSSSQIAIRSRPAYDELRRGELENLGLVCKVLQFEPKRQSRPASGASVVLAHEGGRVHCLRVRVNVAAPQIPGAANPHALPRLLARCLSTTALSLSANASQSLCSLMPLSVPTKRLSTHQDTVELHIKLRALTAKAKDCHPKPNPKRESNPEPSNRRRVARAVRRVGHAGHARGCQNPRSVNLACGLEAQHRRRQVLREELDQPEELRLRTRAPS
eukprot:6173071-Pleurochrysis_carterae.AAC.1